MTSKALLLRRILHQKLRELASAGQAWKAQLPMMAHQSNLTSVVRDSSLHCIYSSEHIPVLEALL